MYRSTDPIYFSVTGILNTGTAYDLATVLLPTSGINFYVPGPLAITFFNVSFVNGSGTYTADTGVQYNLMGSTGNLGAIIVSGSQFAPTGSYSVSGITVRQTNQASTSGTVTINFSILPIL